MYTHSTIYLGFYQIAGLSYLLACKKKDEILSKKIRRE